MGLLAQAAGVLIIYLLLGGADPTLFAGASTAGGLVRAVTDLPSNGSPFCAPIPVLTIGIGVRALCAAERAWFQ